MSKGVEWHKHVIKVTETLTNPQLLYMRIALTVQKLTVFKVKTNESCFPPCKTEYCLLFLTSIYGLTTLFAAAERSEGENRRRAVLRVRSPDFRPGRGQRFIDVRGRKRTQS